MNNATEVMEGFEGEMEGLAKEGPDMEREKYIQAMYALTSLYSTTALTQININLERIADALEKSK